MGRLLQGAGRLLAAEAAFGGRGETRRRRLLLGQFRARAGRCRPGARHSRHHRHADRRARLQARCHRRLWRDRRADRPRRPRPRGGCVRARPPDRRRSRALRCSILSTTRRSSPARAAPGWRRWTSLPRKDAEADLVFCPVGGGGLIGGVSLAFHYLSPRTAILWRRAGRLQRHGCVHRAWRDRDGAARGQHRSATA